jgi:hypothetical protein
METLILAPTLVVPVPKHAREPTRLPVVAASPLVVLKQTSMIVTTATAQSTALCLILIHGRRALSLATRALKLVKEIF